MRVMLAMLAHAIVLVVALVPVLVVALVPVLVVAPVPVAEDEQKDAFFVSWKTLS